MSHKVKLTALRAQTGSYGSVEAGQVVEVDDDTASQLIKSDPDGERWKKGGKGEPVNTAEDAGPDEDDDDDEDESLPVGAKATGPKQNKATGPKQNKRK